MQRREEGEERRNLKRQLLENVFIQHSLRLSTHSHHAHTRTHALMLLRVSLEVNCLVDHNATERAHQFKGHLEALQLTGEQMKSLHLDKIALNPIPTSLKVLYILKGFPYFTKFSF